MNENQGDTLPPLNVPNQQPSPDGLSSPNMASHNETSVSAGIEKGQSMVNPSLPTAIPQQSSTDDTNSPATDLGPPAFPAGVSPSVGTPQIADDVDLIEKEWVDKAKEIVDKTKNDPYMQNKEMSKVKADYLKKRYNRDVKLVE